MVPVALILKQPDLGTATLIMASGLFVVFCGPVLARVIGNRYRSHRRHAIDVGIRHA